MNKGLEAWTTLQKKIDARLSDEEVDTINKNIALAEIVEPVNENAGGDPYDSGEYRRLDYPGVLGSDR